MTTFKLHLPSLVLVFWALALANDHRPALIGLALASIGGAVYVHTRTMIQLYRAHHGPFDRRHKPR